MARTGIAEDTTISPRRSTCMALLATALFVCLVVAWSPDPLVEALMGEFGIVETATALFYALGVVLAIAVVRRSEGRERAHWMLWVFLCVLFFGEETSWLQHWIGFQTPESIRAINSQSEFNLHNMLDDPLLDGGGVVVSWGSLFSSQQLFQLGFAVYFLLLPLAMRWVPADRFLRAAGLPGMSPGFLLVVWLPVALTIVLTVVHTGDLPRRALIAETRELFYAASIALLLALGALQTAHRPSARIQPGSV